MSKYTQIGVAALVALLVSLVAVYFVKPENRITEKVVEKTGAFPGTEFLVDRLTFNGLDKYTFRKSLATGTSTVCSIRSPNATTTLVSAHIRIENATATTLLLESGKSGTNPTATGTPLVYGADGATTFSLAAQTKANIRFSEFAYGSSTAGQQLTLDSELEFAPNAYLNFRVGGQSGDDTTENTNAYQFYTPLGACEAEFNGY